MTVDSAALLDARRRAGRGQTWTGTWGAAPAGPPPSARLVALDDQTLRLVVRIGNGGNRVRIRLSNKMGSGPLRIGAPHIGIRASGGVVTARLLAAFDSGDHLHPNDAGCQRMANLVPPGFVFSASQAPEDIVMEPVLASPAPAIPAGTFPDRCVCNNL